MKEIIIPKSIELPDGKIMNIDNFRWKSHYNKCFMYPRNMKTSHLFFTLRMIYNNNVPTTYRHHPVKLYKFSSFYSAEYMNLAVIAIMLELNKRDDLTPYMLKGMKFIREGLRQLMSTKLEENQEYLEKI